MLILNKTTNADFKNLTLTLQMSVIDFAFSHNTNNSLDYLGL